MLDITVYNGRIGALLENLKKAGKTAMYLPQTYRGKPAVCVGACRGVENGAEGQGWGKGKRGKSGLGEKK